MNQIKLFPEYSPPVPKPKIELIRSYGFDQIEIIKSILHLHNAGNPPDLDLTYSTGGFYRSLPKPMIRFDLYPQATDTHAAANAAHIPLKSGSVHSIMWDPPFLPKNINREHVTGIMEQRFSGFPNVRIMLESYRKTMFEMYRVLKPNGIAITKCQDLISGKKQVFSHQYLMNEAAAAGFYLLDLFILITQNLPISPNMKNQRHARKYHSYFLVFQKSRKRNYTNPDHPAINKEN